MKKEQVIESLETLKELGLVESYIPQEDVPYFNELLSTDKLIDLVTQRLNSDEIKNDVKYQLIKNYKLALLFLEPEYQEKVLTEVTAVAIGMSIMNELVDDCEGYCKTCTVLSTIISLQLDKVLREPDKEEMKV